jgi:hypothetical protein
MFRALIIGLILFAVSAVSAFAQQSVNGYYRQNGTYVQPYTRSSPDGSVTNNYSYSGNVNPYTGATGTNHYTHDQTSPYYSGPDMYGHVGHGGN